MLSEQSVDGDGGSRSGLSTQGDGLPTEETTTVACTALSTYSQSCACKKTDYALKTRSQWLVSFLSRIDLNPAFVCIVRTKEAI